MCSAQPSPPVAPYVYSSCISYQFVALIASITLFMTFFMSMISSIAADQLGIRKMAAVGGVLSFIGILSSSFVHVSGKLSTHSV